MSLFTKQFLKLSFQLDSMNHKKAKAFCIHWPTHDLPILSLSLSSYSISECHLKKKLTHKSVQAVLYEGQKLCMQKLLISWQKVIKSSIDQLLKCSLLLLLLLQFFALSLTHMYCTRYLGQLRIEINSNYEIFISCLRN